MEYTVENYPRFLAFVSGCSLSACVGVCDTTLNGTISSFLFLMMKVRESLPPIQVKLLFSLAY